MNSMEFMIWLKSQQDKDRDPKTLKLLQEDYNELSKDKYFVDNKKAGINKPGGSFCGVKIIPMEMKND